MKRKNRSIILLVIMLGTLILPLLAGCKQEVPPEKVAEQYLTLWKDGKYKEAYEMLSEESAKAITLEDFQKKYQNIYQAIGLSSIQYTPGELIKEKDQIVLPFSATYTSAVAGELKYQFRLPLVKVKEGWKVEWTPALIFPQMQTGDQIRVYTQQTNLQPARGEIFDRDKNPLAINGYAATVFGNPDKIQNAQSFAGQLAPLLNMKAEDVIGILNSKETQRDKVAIFKAFPPDQMTAELQEKLLAIKGVGIDTKHYTKARLYPEGSLLAHALGYTGVISENELESLSSKGYQVDQRIGKKGLEQAFELQMAGKRGLDIQILDSAGKKKEALISSPKEDGYDLFLTIDSRLQKKAEELLKGQRGSVVVLDPTTGEILALASAPIFDPNLFSFKLSQAQLDELQSPEQGNPMFNRTTQGLYPPGSTFKPFTAALGLEAGKITPDFVFDEAVSNNQWKPSGRNWPYPPITRVPHPAGTLNLENALTWSDNIYFAYTALQVGNEAFKDFTQKMGLGEAPPFDLGLSKSQLANKGELKSEKLLADSGYGQGEMLITPLQMAVSFSAFANNGSIMKPRLVESIQKPSGDKDTPVQSFAAEVWKKDVIKPETVQTILPGLIKVVSDPSGTGRKAQIPGVTIAAKTGTAEIGSDKSKEIAWFIGFTTDQNPKRLVCVTLEVPAGQGGDVKQNIAKELLTP